MVLTSKLSMGRRLTGKCLTAHDAQVLIAQLAHDYFKLTFRESENLLLVYFETPFPKNGRLVSQDPSPKLNASL
jgi:hypothetical protein